MGIVLSCVKSVVLVYDCEAARSPSTEMKIEYVDREGDRDTVKIILPWLTEERDKRGAEAITRKMCETDFKLGHSFHTILLLLSFSDG